MIFFQIFVFAVLALTVCVIVEHVVRERRRKARKWKRRFNATEEEASDW